jgi:hypothetical protein
MKLPILQSSLVCTTSSPLGPNILLTTLFTNTLNLCSSLSVTDQVPHPYKRIGKIILFYILIFKHLERQEDKRLWKNGARTPQI